MSFTKSLSKVQLWVTSRKSRIVFLSFNVSRENSHHTSNSTRIHTACGLEMKLSLVLVASG